MFQEIRFTNYRHIILSFKKVYLTFYYEHGGMWNARRVSSKSTLEFSSLMTIMHSIMAPKVVGLFINTQLAKQNHFHINKSRDWKTIWFVWEI